MERILRILSQTGNSTHKEHIKSHCSHWKVLVISDYPQAKMTIEEQKVSLGETHDELVKRLDDVPNPNPQVESDLVMENGVLPVIVVDRDEVITEVEADMSDVMNFGKVLAKPNYNLVLYFAADRPIAKDSLLEIFINGTNTFRDSRFKLIPSIVDGYWMVKRVVGSRACLLGKVVSCNYLREDNFLEVS
ncbi:unnamed protein product [Lactuca virosa]|uniref:Protein ENHANCED DISEASE RESISTANCE 2 C-terminal domain-containing protein n=1 Tax=Lactuca virosa TaxID=75947 RepID=A0AAU9PGW3_9ASTR|nr:unnamed protein product [Lactuca virosa]